MRPAIRSVFFPIAWASLLMTVIPALAVLPQPVQTTSGPITGTPLNDVLVFKGIPYAKPPVGPLRWRAPVPPEPWDQPRAMTDYGPSCPQPRASMGGWDRHVFPIHQSEDCLYLNVWTPAKAPSDRLPVMVWIHGGGFVQGSGSMRFYDGQNLARRGVVVVTLNYRLGPFGFFNHPALQTESDDGSAGNYGLRDQIAALKWIQDNIAALGGDPGNVTIFGESAGGVSVATLMTSPPAQGLFHKAIAQSGAVPQRVPNLQTSQGLWRGRL